MFICLLAIVIYINYKFNNDDVYFISSKKIIDIIEGKLINEGYYIKNVKRGVYKIYPVLYGERK
jgi:hypothetical protein